MGLFQSRQVVPGLWSFARRNGRRPEDRETWGRSKSLGLYRLDEPGTARQETAQVVTTKPSLCFPSQTWQWWSAAPSCLLSANGYPRPGLCRARVASWDQTQEGQ